MRRHRPARPTRPLERTSFGPSFERIGVGQSEFARTLKCLAGNRSLKAIVRHVQRTALGKVKVSGWDAGDYGAVSRDEPEGWAAAVDHPRRSPRL